MANIEKRGDSYRIRVSAGYDENGKQITKKKTWTPPAGMSAKKAEKEAQREAALFEELVRNGQVADGKRMKFHDFADKWLSDYAETNLRVRTVARYKELLIRTNAAIGHLYLNQIQPAHLMRFYKELATTTRASKRHCMVDLKSYLKEQEITKAECAARAGVSCAVLSSVYQGKNIDAASAEKLAQALKVPVASLFEEVDGDKTLSAKTVLHYHRLISSIMEKAVKWQYIVSNPCERVDPPKVQNAAIQCLDAEQAVHMLECLGDAPIPYKTAVTVLLFTGMRRGELLGLEWSDIDFQNQTISISRSSLYLAEKGVFEDETKTASSNRVIKAPKAALAALKSLHGWQLGQRLALGNQWQDSKKCFTALDGNSMHPDTLSGWFLDFIKKTDLPAIHLHCLRHTCASLNLANGIAVTTVAGQLGHANATTTIKIYAHEIKAAQAAAADMMDSLLTGKCHAN